MRNYFVLLVLISSSLFSQKAMTFKEAELAGIRASELDSIYPSGLHADSTKAVFWNEQEKFVQAYQDMLQQFGKYLKKNNFTWGKETRCFNRIYFNEKGKVDYFLYNFNKDAISEEKQKQFQNLLNKFIGEYRFPMQSKTGFAQCSPVRYND